MAGESGLAVVPGRGQITVQVVARLFDDWFSGLSPSTRRNYGKDLDVFAEFIGAKDRREAAFKLCGGTTLDARDHLLRFKTTCRGRREAPATTNRRLSAIRSLYKHVTGAPLVVSSVKNVKRRRVHDGGSDEVFALLEAAAQGKGIKGLRDVALVATIHDSGLRRAEAASLSIRDLELEDRVAWVVGKGRQGERESVILSEPAVEALRAYLLARGKLKPDSPVFASLDRARKGSGALTADGIHSVIESLSERARLRHRIAPHDLRRFGARSLAKAGADSESLRRWGRWSDYKTPAQYVGEVDGKDREAVDLLARLRQTG